MQNIYLHYLLFTEDYSLTLHTNNKICILECKFSKEQQPYKFEL